MPKKMEKELKKEAKKKGLSGERADAYVYGTMYRAKATLQPSGNEEDRLETFTREEEKVSKPAEFEDICELCEETIPKGEKVHTHPESGNTYCDECWIHRKEEIDDAEGVEEDDED